MGTPKQIINNKRRQFLSMLAKGGVSTSALQASSLVGGLMATRFAQAQGRVKRVVFVYTPDGAPNDLWLPDGNNLNASTLAYEGLQSVCHFREVCIVGSGHGLSRKSLGQLRWGSSPLDDSIDQQIASVLGVTSPYESIALGVQTNSELISQKAGSLVPCQNSPAAAYQTLFGSAPPAGGAAQYLARKQSVMDIHHSALSSLKNKLGAFEKTLIESHESALNSIEKRLVDASTTEVSDSCKAPAWNRYNYDTQGPIPDGEVGIFGHQAELQADIITAAFECGLSNVMTLQLGTDQASWYGHNTAYAGDHHGSCHAAPAEANAEMTNYLSGCVAYLIRQLMERDDPAVPGTKLLDNTLVVQVTDMGDGRDHSAWFGPNLIATRMPEFKVGVATRSEQDPAWLNESTGESHPGSFIGNNLQLLEGVVHGLGLESHMGTDASTHSIWPCAGELEPDFAILT